MGRGARERRRSGGALARAGRALSVAGRTDSPAALIGVDWGTTSARAYRIDAAGAVIGEREAALGIQHVRNGAFAGALATLLGDWIADRAPRLACGMIGSRQGWVEAPYVACPAPFEHLARALARTPDAALAIVPGVSCRDAHGVPDVMRGEETQIVGALADDAPTTLVVLPGTHSKWALAGAGRIETFASFMTGEVYAVLKTHSILGRLMTDDAIPSSSGFLRGVRAALATTRAAGPPPRPPGRPKGAAVASHGSAQPPWGERRVATLGGQPTPGALLHLLFGARTLALFDELAAPEIADYLSGLLIGSEVVAGRTWAAACNVVADEATLIGSPALTARYELALREAGLGARTADRAAAARGLWRIARAAAIVR